jgi:tetratricopeptide (TPR) repeat protein
VLISLPLRSGVVVSASVLALALSLVMTAAPSSGSVRQLVDDAQKAYARGNYAEAARLLEAAGKLDPSGRILFNLARALEKAGEVEKAIVIYEAYLDRPDAELPALRRARQALAVLYRKRPPAPEPPPKNEPPKTEPPVVEPVEAAPEPTKETPKATEPPKDLVQPVASIAPVPVPSPPPRPLRTVGIVGLITGGVAAGVGVGLGLWAQSTARSARASLDPTQKPLLVSAALQRATATDFTFLGAGVVAATGLVLFLIDVLTQ